MKGYAPGWQVRCLKCGVTFDASDLGIIRVAGFGKSYKLFWCEQCGWFRCFALERKPADLPEYTAPRCDIATYKRRHRPRS
jgi:hypothetical protein